MTSTAYRNCRASLARGKALVFQALRWKERDTYFCRAVLDITAERWEHILASRPELEPHFDQFLDTLRTGDRKQDALIPNKYRYSTRCDALLPENTHLVVIVIFQTQL